MPSKRKLWKVQYFCGAQVGPVRPESKVMAYRYVEHERTYYSTRSQEHRDRTRYIEVLVDIRDGRGFQTHELVDMEETADA